MPVHDWTRVEAGIFHHFHLTWIAHLSEALKPILPRGYYALAEQHLGRKEGDVLALHASDPEVVSAPPEPPEGGAVAVAEVPPKVERTLVAPPVAKGVRRTLTVRHVTGHRIIALVEILSPSNVATADSVADFVKKALAGLRSKIHLVVVDLFPPGKPDPQGVNAEIWQRLDPEEGEEYVRPPNKPFTLASYSAGYATTVYLRHLSPGEPLQDMPLFLTAERYVNLPLAPTYESAFGGMPDFWREVLQGPNVNGA
jgi:hypothetical protein